MASGAVVYIPAIAANVIQAGEGIPGAVIQPARAVQYIPYAGQQVGSPNNQPQQNRHVKTWEKLLKMETKTLGAVQILIGLMQIGFGALLLFIISPSYVSFAALGGYPFWGGAFAKCSVGMSITSSVMSAAGTILYISDLAFNQCNSYYWQQNVGFGLSFLLLLFTLLELCITVLMSHIGCQETCYNQEMTMFFVPYPVSAGAVVPPENNLAPLCHDLTDFSPKKE